MTDHRYYVGAIGSLVAFPDRLSDVDVAESLLGGVHVSAGGTQTVDGVKKKAWSWSWDDLLPHQRAYAEALSEDMVAGPLRLLLPRRANRLPAQVASGGSVRSSPSGFVASAGPLRFRRHDQIAVGRSSLPAAPYVKGGIGWSVPVVSGGRLRPSWGDSGGVWRLPLLPGEQVVLSAWACAPLPDGVGEDEAEPVVARVGWDEYRPSGVVAREGPPVLLRSDRWRLLTRTVTPGRGAVALTPGLLVPPITPAETDGGDGGGGADPLPGGGGAGVVVDETTREVVTTCWQAAAVGAEALPPTMRSCDMGDVAQGWRPGGGAPEVVVAGGSTTYGLPWLTNTGITLVEA